MSDQPNHVTLADAYTRIRDAAVDAAIHFSNAEVRNNAISGENRQLTLLDPVEQIGELVSGGVVRDKRDARPSPAWD